MSDFAPKGESVTLLWQEKLVESSKKCVVNAGVVGCYERTLYSSNY